MSVVLADILEAPQSPSECVTKFPGYGLAELTAGTARRLNQGVAHTPTPEEPAHGSVIGRKTGAVKNGLRDGAIVLLVPAGT